MTLSLKGKIALLAAILFWASAFVGIRAALMSYSPGGLALFRFLIASIVMYIIYKWRANRRPLQVRDLFFALFSGVIGLGIYNIALNYGERLVPSGMASFIISQGPVITTLFAIGFLAERINKMCVVGMLISAMGVGLITLSESVEFEFYLNIFYVFIATVVGSLYSIFQKALLLKKYDAIDLTAYAIWGGALLLLIFIPDLWHDLAGASYSATVTVVYLGICPTALGYLAWGYVLSEISASRASNFFYTMPIVVTLMGWVWLDEVPTVIALAGGFISLLGVWLVNRSFVSVERKPVLTTSAVN